MAEKRSFSGRHSAVDEEQLFDRPAQRAFVRSLTENEKRRAVRLKSRTFVSGRVASTKKSLLPEGELYLTFSQNPSTEEREQLADKGIVLYEHITRTTWRTWVRNAAALSACADLRGVEYVWPEDKISERLWKQSQAIDTGQLDVIVEFDETLSETRGVQILAAVGAKVTGLDLKHIRIAADRVADLGGYAAVRYLSTPPPPEKTLNANAAALSRVDDVQEAPYSLTGLGMQVCVRDSGRVAAHGDFESRLTVIDNASISDHATHVAGTIGGSGAGSSLAKGMAPSVQIYSYDWEGNVETELRNADSDYNVRLSNHSYGHVIGWDDGDWHGNDLFGKYSSAARAVDDAVHERDLIVCWSAGNDRNDSGTPAGSEPNHDGTYYDGDYYDCLGDRASAKNVIAVGAVSDTGAMTSFSSWGPTDDGRIKPDIVANGNALYSTISASGYGSKSGTSMSSPTVCGIMALLMEQYGLLNAGADLPAALAKALLINTARDRGRAGPDYAYGWGLADAKAAVDILRAHHSTNQLIATDSVSQNETNRFWLIVPPGSDSLKITLVWIDPEGSTAAADAIKNDLDLSLISPQINFYFPYVMPFAQSGASPALPAVTGTNEWDTVEQVELTAPQSGAWQVLVKGSSLATSSQNYYLTVSGGSLQTDEPVAARIAVMPTHLVCEANIEVGAYTDSVTLLISNAGSDELTFSITDDTQTNVYTWADSNDPGGPAFDWVDIASNYTAEILLAEEDESSMLDIGFPFPFYGNSYTQFQIAANGGISFDPGNLYNLNQPLPVGTNYAPSLLVAPFWNDLGIWWETDTYFYRRDSEQLVITFPEISLPGDYSEENPNTFQVILHKDGRIVFQYLDMQSAVDTATVGIQGGSEGPAIQVACNEPYITNGLAVEFRPPLDWLSYSSAAGAVEPLSSTSLLFVADASMLETGTYQTVVTILHNDPTHSAVKIPLVFTVSGSSGTPGDLDGDGLPDDWETLYFGDLSPRPGDLSSNGVDTVYAAYIAGLDPTDPNAVFLISVLCPPSFDPVLGWDAASGRVYSIWWASNLLNETFIPLQSNLISGVFTDSLHGTEQKGFYRIDVQLE